MKFVTSNSNLGDNVFAKSPSLYRLPLHHKIQRLWQVLTGYLRREESELQVWVTGDRSGPMTWNARNTRTQRAIYGVSEHEIRCWVEKQLQHPDSP